MSLFRNYETGHAHSLGGVVRHRSMSMQGSKGPLTVPTHIEVTAIFCLDLLSSDMTVTICRAPVQPNGCPKALVRRVVSNARSE
jgi:hypothetical protein